VKGWARRVSIRHPRGAEPDQLLEVPDFARLAGLTSLEVYARIRRVNKNVTVPEGKSSRRIVG
jgi:hypothetical protein